MLIRYLDAITPPLLQADFLRHATLALVPDECRANLDELHEHFPSLAIVIPEMLSQVSAKDVGRFFAVLERTAIWLMTFLLQDPIPEQMQFYCEEMQNYIEVECAACPALGELNLGELAALCEVKLQAAVFQILILP
jgi:hypothetical protein